MIAKRQPPMRVYVKVTSDFDATGAMTPKAITWADGRIYKIDTVRDFRPASSFEPGRTGDCFTVMIQGKERFLFFERTNSLYGSRFGRWWVECAPTPAVAGR